AIVPAVWRVCHIPPGKTPAGFDNLSMHSCADRMVGAGRPQPHDRADVMVRWRGRADVLPIRAWRRSEPGASTECPGRRSIAPERICLLSNGSGARPARSGPCLLLLGLF